MKSLIRIPSEGPINNTRQNYFQCANIPKMVKMIKSSQISILFSFFYTIIEINYRARPLIEH